MKSAPDPHVDHIEIWHEIQISTRPGVTESIRRAWAVHKSAGWIETGVRFDDAEGAGNDGPILRLLEETTCARTALEALECKLLAAAALIRGYLETTQIKGA